MKRETYIQIRKSNNLVLLAYNHYYEKCLEKGQNPLDFSGFAEWFPQYIGASHIVDSLVKHYDNFFEIIITVSNSFTLAWIFEFYTFSKKLTFIFAKINF